MSLIYNKMEGIKNLKSKNNISIGRIIFKLTWTLHRTIVGDFSLRLRFQDGRKLPPY